VMTATPIPRTMTLTIYGDLDLSVLDELPPGRHPIVTRWASAMELPRIYDLIRADVQAGRQAYVVCPLVEQSELLQMQAATTMAEELRLHVFPDLRVGLLHGRLKPEEKDAAMEAFHRGETQVLVCTVVIEVGVDVPNASVMLIHGAERFGLAQLHQLRGRVGRSSYPSTCVLVTPARFDPAHGEGEDLAARKRLRVMLSEQDGFRIAEADLEIRGPGEMLGTKQSGLLTLHVADLARDAQLLVRARAAAQALIADDPTLEHPDHAALRRQVARMSVRLDAFRE
jgi:ATP-dependent DNA helicase RecG